jgi:hypothetical protein
VIVGAEQLATQYVLEAKLRDFAHHASRRNR